MTTVNLEEIAGKEKQRQKQLDVRLVCCAGTGCLSAGSETIQQALEQWLKENDRTEKAQIVKSGCMGLCSLGPLMRVESTNGIPMLYGEVTPDVAVYIVKSHLNGDKGDSTLPSRHTIDLNTDFFRRQQKIVLANAGRIDAESIEEYIAEGGYQALRKALLEMTPEEVIEQIRISGLRGRGGGGFPTAIKWNNTLHSEGEEKFVICNGDEGDPGAYMDRNILEGDPHAVIEGMLLAGYATGATEGFFYIRAEYPLAIDRIEKALKQARRKKLLGKQILGTDFSFNLEIRLGAGAFVCGEETALIASIEGRRGTPTPRPPYPSVRGLWNAPTCVNNVETLANVPRIIQRGGDWFASIGTEESKGTKVFALTGKIKHSGLVEVPMGTPLSTIIFEIGGGSSTGKPIKAIQTGGPSGGIIPEDFFDTPVSYEHLQRLGSIMGSGGMIVMDSDDSMVDIAKFYMGFTVDESCGKCAPCRIGGPQMLKILERLSRREGRPDDLGKLKQLALTMQRSSLCGLGQTAPNPVLSALQYFEDEYQEMIAPIANE